MVKGKLHLIPNILAENGHRALPAYLSELVGSISFFVVEEIKSARRLLKKLNPSIQIDALEFRMMNDHEKQIPGDAIDYLLHSGDVGFISEAGCPGIADPGQPFVAEAHRLNIEVCPHTGPNSLLLALMASGFSGQHFSFHGYLPNKQPQLSQKIKELELDSQRRNASQLFIETPYRNEQLLTELIRTARPETRLCIAIGLTGPDQRIETKELRAWANKNYSLHKIPAVFILFAGQVEV